MFKIIILIGPVAETPAFGEEWPQFLHHAEAMPGLLREATIRVKQAFYGESDIRMIHELYFENRPKLNMAMASHPGQAAGQVLQQITGGQMNLLVAEHKEDSIENLRSYRQENSHADSQ